MLGRKRHPYRSRSRSRSLGRHQESGNSSVHGVGSLIGGSGISLDGQSLMLPDDVGDEEDIADDVSSIGGSVKEIETKTGAETSLTDMRVHVTENAVVRTSPPAPPPSNHAPSVNGSSIQKDIAPPIYNGPGDAGKRRCIPLWIRMAPTWLRLLLVASVALLVAAVALVAVGLLLALNRGDTSRSSIQGSDFSYSSDTPAPTPAPFVLLIDTLSPVQETKPRSPPLKKEEPKLFPDPTPAPIVPPEPIVMPNNATGNVTSNATIYLIGNGNTTGNESAPVATSSPNATILEEDLIQTMTSVQTPTEATVTDMTSSPEPVLLTSAPSNPTSTPTVRATDPPTLAPTLSPVMDPTLSPVQATRYPSQGPMSTPSAMPTQAPTLGTSTFYATAGRYVSDLRTEVPDLLSRLPQADGNAFLVNLGDWNSPAVTDCDEESYQNLVNLFQNSSVPVYFVVGDNEYNDCSDPTEAIGFWDFYLIGYETQFWDEQSWSVWRQDSGNEENFAFFHNGIIFVGLNLVGGGIHDGNEWTTRHLANLAWIDLNYQYYRQADARVFVIFAHASPLLQSNANFYEPLFDRIEDDYSDMLFLLVHRNLVTEDAGLYERYYGIDNLSVVIVQGSVWPPMQVQIDLSDGGTVIRADQSDWDSVSNNASDRAR